MSDARELFRRMRMLFHRRQFQAELEEEIRLHLELREQERAENGVGATAAKRDAYLKFGNPTVIREKSYMTWGWGWLESLVQDTRYALRQLWKTPGFTITAILMLALGIGANAAIFTLVNTVLLKNLPVADPKMLVRIGDIDGCCIQGEAPDDGDFVLFSTNTYEQFKKNVPEFADLAAIQAGFSFNPITARRDGSNTPARSSVGEFVSGNYFHTFGLQPAAGRLFTDADDVTGAPMTAVMSYEAWKNNYAGDASVVGSTFWINTRPVTVIGVAPEGFYGDRLSGSPPDFYLPIKTMSVLANAEYINDPAMGWLYLVGRIKPGVELVPLQEKLSAQLREYIAPTRLFTSTHDRSLLTKAHVELTPGGAGIQDMQDTYASNLKLLMWISGLVLLIACANIANLLLVRGMARKAEMSLRTALGAMRGRIIRQLLTESILLAGLSGTAALAVSYAGARMLLALAFPEAEHLPIHASPSWEVLGFALGVSILTGVLFGVAPAWITAQAEPADALRRGVRTTQGGTSLLQRGLVILQAALSLVLLVGAGMFTQSLTRLQNVDMKLDTRNRYIVHINPEAAGYAPARLAPLYRAIEDQFHAIPGIVKVGISSYTPMESNHWGSAVQIEGQPDQHLDASYLRANAEYFDSVGTKIVMGRVISVQDTSTAPGVAVVTESFVKKFFKPDENPIGRRFGAPGPNSTGDYEIVGVVVDTAYHSVQWQHIPMYFVPLTQRPPSSKVSIEDDTSLYAGAIVLETVRPVGDMEALVRKTLAGINPSLTVVKFQTFREQVLGMFNQQRMISQLMTLFGLLALLLATVGLYGVTSYSVARRTSEIGIRMALGAERSGVVAMILRGALLQTLLGLAIGIPVAFFGVKLVKSQLYDLTTVSGGALAVAVGTLLAAACLAGTIPAKRAASVDPARALRAE
jgi:macrolide transport system ATP-binding/permease protein